MVAEVTSCPCAERACCGISPVNDCRRLPWSPWSIRAHPHPSLQPLSGPGSALGEPGSASGPWVAVVDGRADGKGAHPAQLGACLDGTGALTSPSWRPAPPWGIRWVSSPCKQPTSMSLEGSQAPKCTEIPWGWELGWRGEQL